MLNRNFKHESPRLSEEELTQRVSSFGVKAKWFLEAGYEPHYYQWIFHTLQNEEGIGLRFRHLVAGRRGGKTLSAAWEVLFYCLHPAEFHWDFHHKQDDRPLHVWILTKDYPTGNAAWRDGMLYALRIAGVEAKINKGDRYIEFPNGSLVEFKTAVDPESLRGAGLDILWIDEAALITSGDAYTVARPALADKIGIVMTTTTPKGKNWFYKTFWSDKALNDKYMGRVEYWSIDNPYFTREEWEYMKDTYHPLMFKQEFMAAFDSMAGVELHGEWLKYYTYGEPEADQITLPKLENRKNEYALSYYIGVDPAISLRDDADKFAISLIGVTKNREQAFLIDVWSGRIPFPEQVDKITEWYYKWKDKGYGCQYVGVEANVYQRALVQQLERVPGLIPIVPVFSTGKKEERILRMAPTFRTGRIRIREDHRDFIEEWLSYDTSQPNPDDDCLDATEIALAGAGGLLPLMKKKEQPQWSDLPAATIDEWARRDLPGSPYLKDRSGNWDEQMGGDW